MMCREEISEVPALTHLYSDHRSGSTVVKGGQLPPIIQFLKLQLLNKMTNMSLRI